MRDTTRTFSASYPYEALLYVALLSCVLLYTEKRCFCTPLLTAIRSAIHSVAPKTAAVVLYVAIRSAIRSVAPETAAVCYRKALPKSAAVCTEKRLLPKSATTEKRCLYVAIRSFELTVQSVRHCQQWSRLRKQPCCRPFLPKRSLPLKQACGN